MEDWFGAEHFIGTLELIEASSARITALKPAVKTLPTLCLDRARDHAKLLMNGHGRVAHAVLGGRKCLVWGGIAMRFCRRMHWIRIGRAMLCACVALLMSVVGAQAGGEPTSYVQPPLPWHEIPADQAPVQLNGAVPIRAVFINDGWNSRYQVEFDVAGGLVRYEKPRHAYSADISLKRVFYQVYGQDTVLGAQGITPGIDDANLTTIAGRPTAYLAWQGKDATCFAFVSQFGTEPGGSRDQMLNGSVCRPRGEVDPVTLSRQWLALLEHVVVR